MDVIVRPALGNAKLRRVSVVSLAGAVPTLGLAAAMFARALHQEGSSFLLPGVLGIAALLLLVIAAFGLGEWLYHRNATLFIKDDVIGMTDVWGRTTVDPLHNLARIELGQRLRSVGKGRTVPVASTRFVSTANQTMFEVRGREFSLTDLRILSETAQAPMVGSWDDPPATLTDRGDSLSAK